MDSEEIVYEIEFDTDETDFTGEGSYDEEEEIDSEEIVYEIEFDGDEFEFNEEEGEEDMGLYDYGEDDEPVMESKKMSIKPKGVGIGNPNKKKIYSNKCKINVKVI